MSIEQKVAQILAESRAKDSVEELSEDNVVTKNAAAGDQAVIRPSGSVPNGGETPNEANAKNNVEDEDSAANATSKKANTVTAKAEAGDQAVIRTAKDSIPATAPGAAVNFKEDMDALFNGEELTEEFKTKATTIFESAVMTRINEAMTTIEEEFDAKLEEAVAQNQEGLVEKVDGYLSYIAEQWMENNEIALESGMKSEILEGFVSGLKGLFEEHYIDIPEEKFDVLGAQEEAIAELQAKLDEQLAQNVELTQVVNEATREAIIVDGAEGLSDTDKEKFFGLAEELAFEDSESFDTKVKTIRENYFTNKATSTIVESVVTDTPIETLTEAAKAPVDPSISKYMSVLNNLK
jgi:hypothetical protein